MYNNIHYTVQEMTNSDKASIKTMHNRRSAGCYRAGSETVWCGEGGRWKAS
jgi:hypothetical protein